MNVDEFSDNWNIMRSKEWLEKSWNNRLLVLFLNYRQSEFYVYYIILFVLSTPDYAKWTKKSVVFAQPLRPHDVLRSCAHSHWCYLVATNSRDDLNGYNWLGDSRGKSSCINVALVNNNLNPKRVTFWKVRSSDRYLFKYEC